MIIYEKIVLINGKLKQNKLYVLLIFLLFSIIAIKYLNIDMYLTKRPCSMHVWAQCMRASIARNYYEESFNFFLPRLHNVLDGEGITGLEFPLVNYCVAILYKIFGFNEGFFRGFVLFTLFLGLYYMYKLSFNKFNSISISLLVVGVCFFSPVLVYYSSNFMPDTTSLGFVLVGWYCFFKYLSLQNKKYMYIMFLLFALASLVKVTSLISIGVIISVLILDYFKFFHATNENRFLIVNKRPFIVLVFLTILLVFSWYYYANWLSEAYHSNAFTLGSVYSQSKEKFWEIWKVIRYKWFYEYYNPIFYFALLFMIYCIAIFWKSVNRLYFVITFFTVLGSFAFTMLMFYQFKNHDYYIIPLLTSVFLLTFVFMDLINTLSLKYFMSLKYIVSLGLLFVLIENSKYSKINFLDRYSESYYVNTGDFSQYYDLEPVLRLLDIKKHDITLVGSDYTYCNALYLMNQVGYQFNEYNKDDLNRLFNYNPKYLILNDTAKFNNSYPNNLNSKIIGHHKGLIIYKLY